MTHPHEELARIYDEHAEALYAFLLSFTGQEADARDLLQEVFIKLAVRPVPTGIVDGAPMRYQTVVDGRYRLGNASPEQK